MRRIIAAAAGLAISIFSVNVRSDDPVSSSVTFNREVIRILQRKCLQCHNPDGVAMSLATYREVRPWSRSIREELVEQRMPPWGAALGYTPLATTPGLTAREMTVLLTWLDGGVPRGGESDLPQPEANGPASPAPPDALIALPAQRVAAYDEYVVRRVTVDAGPRAPRRLGSLEFRPGERRVLRAAFVSLVTPRGAQWLGAWTPWQGSIAPPAAAYDVPAGAKLEVELHYRGREEEIDDRSSVALFAAKGERATAGQIVIDAAAAPGSDARWRGTSVLAQPTRVWAVVPQAVGQPEDAAGSLEVTALKPDGSVQVLLWVPQYRHDWPTPYVLEHPLPLPAGTTIVITATGLRVPRVTISTVS